MAAFPWEHVLRRIALSTNAEADCRVKWSAATGLFMLLSSQMTLHCAPESGTEGFGPVSTQIVK